MKSLIRITILRDLECAAANEGLRGVDFSLTSRLTGAGHCAWYWSSPTRGMIGRTRHSTSQSV